jgi:acyl phosphate:glycerol-3-phosphate acyltransferase
VSVALSIAGCLAAGYACGSLPWGLWLGRWFRGVDVRTLGSKNLGATNVFRSLGRGLGLATLALDIFKGALPVWIVPQLPLAEAFPGGRELCALAVAFAAVAGHVWTFLAGFKGGKGVATTVGVLLALSPVAFLAFVVVFFVTVGVTRFISLGSMLGAVAFAVTLAFTARGGTRSPTFAFGVAIAILVIARHRANIQRLLAGSERRFQWSRGGDT